MCPLISFGLHIFIHEYGSAATAATYFHARVHYTIHIYIYMSSPARRQNAHSLHERNAHTQAQCAHIVDTARCVWVCMCIFFSHHRRRRRPSISTSVNVLHSDSQSFVDIQTVRMRSGQSRDTAFVILII